MFRWRRRKDRSGWRAAPLFDGMSQDELEALAPLVRERSVRKRELLAREGDLAQELFVVKAGALELVKRDGDHERRLGEVKPGEVAGEVALFDELPRFASLRAEEPSEVYVLAVRDLRPPARGRDRRPRPLKSAYQRIRERLTEVLADRVRDHDDAVLSHARHREAVGTFLVHVLVMVCLYSFLLSGLELLGERVPANTTLVSIPLQLVFAIAAWRIIRTSGYPLSDFGLGFRQLLGSVLEAALLTPLLLGLATGIKWVLLLVRHSAQPLVEHPDIFARLAEPEVVRRLSIYALSCAVQELIVRSALQSSLERFLTGSRVVLQAVLIAALLFAMMHLHISFLFAALAFLPGLFWGWLFARRRHLLGVTLSHVAVGGYVFFVLGVGI
jgi:CRP-like cAMP-binding protein